MSGLRTAVTCTVLTLVAACGGGGDPARLAAEGAWARPTPPAAANGVVYLELTTDTDDELVAVEVTPEVAAAAELHAVATEGGDATHSHGGAAEGETVAMGEVESFAVTPGEALTFEPGGNHIMLVDLAAPLRLGAAFPVTLRLASGRAVEVDVVVADNPPG